jgi:Fur family ferric uptake transcriptional regulator
MGGRPDGAVGSSTFADRAVARLTQEGARITGPRRLLLQVMPTQGGFRAEDLWHLARRRDPSLGRATVFRTLELFARLGIVDRLDAGAEGPQYRACDTPQDTDHHHILCTRCGRSVEVEDTEVWPVLDQLSRRAGYRLTGHHLEMFGLCPSCQVREGATP